MILLPQRGAWLAQPVKCAVKVFFVFRFRFKTFSHLILEQQQSPRFVRITIFDAHPPASCRERGQKKKHINFV